MHSATLLAEGAHGSLSKQANAMYGLREGKEAQTYGIGVKEVWRVKPENHTPGASPFYIPSLPLFLHSFSPLPPFFLSSHPNTPSPGKVLHTLGWPLDNGTYGGGWEYHMADGLVSIG
jgi:electron-transferring-flavoprotein dehydrogenase